MAVDATLLPAEADITIEQGATFRAPFRWRTGTPPVDVDLTGWTAHAQVRNRPGGDFLLELTVDIQPGGETGLLVVRATSAQTATLQRSTAAWDLFLTAPGPGDTVKLLKGAVTIDKRVTTDA